MKPTDQVLFDRLEEGLLVYARDREPLPGLPDAAHRAALVNQLVDSVRRIRYVSVIRGRDIDDRRADPTHMLFDPLKAAILYQRRGDTDEACWLIFLFVHFGKHARGGWQCAARVYGRLGAGPRWTWATTSADPAGFRAWLDANQTQLRGLGPGFGNHRKYQSLHAYSAVGTGAAFATYVAWINPPRTHAQLFGEASAEAGGDAKVAFDLLYSSMDTVSSFGRTAKFDYLTMIGKLGLAQLEPGSAYLDEATGPLSGARLLFGGTKSATLSPAKLQQRLAKLDEVLGVGMQVLEDALCNWQKTPDRYTPFRS